MKKLSVVVSLIISLLVVIFWVSQGYRLVRDVESVAHRAQVAADVSEMLGYMKELKLGVGRHGMTHGYTALIFKTPANDLAKLNGSIVSIIARLEAVKEVPRAETTYQVVLSDLRGTIRELEAPSLGFLWVQYWSLLLVGIGIWIWPVSLFIHDEGFF